MADTPQPGPPKHRSTLRFGGVAEVLSEAQKRVQKEMEDRFRKRLQSLIKSGYLDGAAVPENVLDQLAKAAGRDAGEVARPAMADAVGESFMLGKNSAVSQAEHDAVTMPAPKTPVPTKP